MSEPVFLNPKYAGALENKVGEYRRRLKDPFFRDAYSQADSCIKIAIVEALLATKEGTGKGLDVEKLREELCASYDPKAVDGAIVVVLQYNENGEGGGLLRGGTGLRHTNDGGERNGGAGRY